MAPKGPQRSLTSNTCLVWCPGLQNSSSRPPGREVVPKPRQVGNNDFATAPSFRLNVGLEGSTARWQPKMKSQTSRPRFRNRSRLPCCQTQGYIAVCNVLTLLGSSHLNPVQLESKEFPRPPTLPNIFNIICAG
jgi:hypothetical protein